MSEFRAFFRHCPSCGRRFHIHLVRKQLVDEEVIQERESATEAEVDSSFVPAVSPVTMLEGEQPIVVDVKDFRYTYECRHCGHRWSEEHTESQTVHQRT